jgi:hypothetical protein
MDDRLKGCIMYSPMYTQLSRTAGVICPDSGNVYLSPQQGEGMEHPSKKRRLVDMVLGQQQLHSDLNPTLAAQPTDPPEPDALLIQSPQLQSPQGDKSTFQHNTDGNPLDDGYR